MNHRRQPVTRARVLRWLLAVLTLVGMGVLQTGHCLTGTSTATAASIAPVTGKAPAVLAYGTTAVTDRVGHGHHHTVDGAQPGHSDTAADDCHLTSAPATTATTGTVAVHAPTAVRTTPVVFRPPVPTPRLHSAVALIQICVSRT